MSGRLEVQETSTYGEVAKGATILYTNSSWISPDPFMGVTRIQKKKTANQLQKKEEKQKRHFTE